MDSDAGIVISITLAFCVFFALAIWHITEAECQLKYDVSDCEWSRTPFTPTMQDR